MSDAPDKENSDENLPALDAPPAGGSKKKKMILILVPVLLLIGGGAGLYFSGMLDSVLGKKPAAEAGKEGEKAEGEHGGGEKDEAEGEKKEDEGGGEHGEGGHGGPAFLKVPDLIVNLASDGGGQPRYLRLSVQLELANDADMKAVEAVLPRVIDQFQTYLRELRIQDLRGSKGMYRLQMELFITCQCGSVSDRSQGCPFSGNSDTIKIRKAPKDGKCESGLFLVRAELI